MWRANHRHRVLQRPLLLHLIPEFTHIRVDGLTLYVPDRAFCPVSLNIDLKVSSMISILSPRFYGLRDYGVIAHEAHLANAFRQYCGAYTAFALYSHYNQGLI